MTVPPVPAAPELCPCSCHDELMGWNTVEGRPVRGPVQVRLDDPVETALACDGCHPQHVDFQAEQRRRAA